MQFINKYILIVTEGEAIGSAIVALDKPAGSRKKYKVPSQNFNIIVVG